MELLEKLEKDYILALKEKDRLKADVLNMLKSQIKYKEIELKALSKNLTEVDLLEIIRKEIKKREEAIEMYKQASREDLLKKEIEELEILKSYFPKAPSEEELKEEVKRIIKDLNAKGKSDFGKVMKACIEHFKGAVDNKVLKEVIEKELSQ
ncbi:MAG: GatB/YqeY domain-containing protein [Caldisericaceae bacterium]